MLAFAANTGALAALAARTSAMVGVSVGPAQVGLELADQHGVAGVVRGAHDKGAHRPELRVEFAHDALMA